MDWFHACTNPSAATSRYVDVPPLNPFPDGTNLTADTPIELLGLATLHRHHQPKAARSYWWRIEGSPLLTELMEKSRTTVDTVPDSDNI